MRVKNFAARKIGESLVRVKDGWWIVLTPSQTKEKRSDERPVPEILTRYIDQYVEHYRKQITRLDPAGDSLWVSSRSAEPFELSGRREAHYRHRILSHRHQGQPTSVPNLGSYHCSNQGRR